MCYGLKSDKNCLNKITRISTYLVIIFIMFSVNSGNSVNCLKFFFKMTPHSNKCLGEYLTSNTVGTYFISYYIKC